MYAIIFAMALVVASLIYAIVHATRDTEIDPTELERAAEPKVRRKSPRELYAVSGALVPMRVPDVFAAQRG